MMVKTLQQLQPGDWIKWRGDWVEVETKEDSWPDDAAWVDLSSGRRVSFPPRTQFRVQDESDLEIPESEL